MSPSPWLMVMVGSSWFTIHGSMLMVLGAWLKVPAWLLGRGALAGGARRSSEQPVVNHKEPTSLLENDKTITHRTPQMETS